MSGIQRHTRLVALHSIGWILRLFQLPQREIELRQKRSLWSSVSTHWTLRKAQIRDFQLGIKEGTKSVQGKRFLTHLALQFISKGNQNECSNIEGEGG